MPITAERLDEAKRAYADTAEPLATLTGELKRLRSTIGKQRRVFRRYMEQEDLAELVVGGDTFSLADTERVVCTMERVENAFAATDVADFKKANTEVKKTFKTE